VKPTRKTPNAPVSSPRTASPMSDPAQELAFLSSEKVLTYAGEWVAIAGSKVVAHGPSLLKVRREAEAKLKGRKPTFFAVPKGAATY